MWCSIHECAQCCSENMPYMQQFCLLRQWNRGTCPVDTAHTESSCGIEAFWHHWPLVEMVGAPRRRFMGIWEAMASRLCWKACCIRRCCSSAKRAIFLSGPSPPPVSSFSLNCSRVAALAKPATCCWPRASAMEGLAAIMEDVRSSETKTSGHVIISDRHRITTICCGAQIPIPCFVVCWLTMMHIPTKDLK